MPAQAAPQQTVAGYVLSADFAEFLKKNPSIKQLLSQDAKVADYVMGSPSVQNELISGLLTVDDLQQKFASDSADQRLQAPKGVAVTTSRTAINDLNRGTTTAAEKKAEDELNKLLAGNAGSADVVAVNSASQAINRVVKDQSKPADTSKPGQTTRPPVPVDTIKNYDVNAIPSQADSTPDASGWPKYLAVPEGCPAPKNDKSYFHEPLMWDWRAGDAQGRPYYTYKNLGDMRLAVLSHYGTTPGYTNIAPMFSGDRWMHMRLNQEFAVPLLTPGIGTNFNRLGAFADLAFNGQGRVPNGIPASYGEIRSSVSYCPGDYTGFTPAGKKPLSERCISRWQDSGAIMTVNAHSETTAYNALKDKGLCVLENAERYFYNLSISLDKLAEVDFPTKPTPEEYQNRPIVIGLNTSGHFGIANPPESAMAIYSGPCLSAPPYPAGYRSGDCGETRTLTTDGSGGNSQNSTFTCYDPYNLEAPVTFSRLWDPNTGKLTWTQGYRKPLFSRFVCEGDSPNHPSHYHLVPKVCAVHREGELREKVQTSPINNINYREVAQCQFNPTTKYFDWTRVVQSELVPHYMQGTNISTTVYERPLEHTGCMVGNKVYAYGTKASVSCGSASKPETAEMVCTERKTLDGSRSLLGTFEFTKGYIPDYSLVVASNRCRYTFN